VAEDPAERVFRKKTFFCYFLRYAGGWRATKEMEKPISAGFEGRSPAYRSRQECQKRGQAPPAVGGAYRPAAPADLGSGCPRSRAAVAAERFCRSGETYFESVSDAFA